MNHLQTHIEELLQDHQTRHSQLQIDAFIIGKSSVGHPYGAYRQCLRELNSRYQQRFEIMDLLEEYQLDVEEECAKEFSEGCSRIEAKRAQIAMRRIKRKIERTHQDLKELDREIQRFYELTASAKQLVGELTPERRNVLDREFWVHKLKFKAAIDILRTGAPSATVLETACTLDEELRMRVMEQLNPGGAQRLIEWFNNGAPMEYDDKQLAKGLASVKKITDGKVSDVPNPF